MSKGKIGKGKQNSNPQPRDSRLYLREVRLEDTERTVACASSPFPCKERKVNLMAIPTSRRIQGSRLRPPPQKIGSIPVKNVLPIQRKESKMVRLAQG